MRYLIIGCGRVGSGLANEMILRGHQVTAVDKDPQAIERLGPAFKGKTIVGFGFDREVLEAAGIQRADGLAAVTASDEANVIAARIARDIYRVPRVVARLSTLARRRFTNAWGCKQFPLSPGESTGLLTCCSTPSWSRSSASAAETSAW